MRISGQNSGKQPLTQFEKDWAALGTAFATVVADVGKLGESLRAFEAALRSAIDSQAGAERPAVMAAADSGTATELLTAVDLVQMLSISRTKLWELRRSGQFPAPIKLGRTARWRRTDIERFIDGLAPKR